MTGRTPVDCIGADVCCAQSGQRVGRVRRLTEPSCTQSGHSRRARRGRLTAPWSQNQGPLRRDSHAWEIHGSTAERWANFALRLDALGRRLAIGIEGLGGYGDPPMGAVQRPKAAGRCTDRDVCVRMGWGWDDRHPPTAALDGRLVPRRPPFVHPGGSLNIALEAQPRPGGAVGGI